MLLLTEAGRRFGLKGISFGGLFPNSSPEPPTPVRRHSWLLHRIEEVGFLEVSVALESSGEERGIGFSRLFACPQPPKLPAPTRPCESPLSGAGSQGHRRVHALALCFRVSPGRNRFPLGASESPFRLVARTISAPQTSATLARRWLGGVRIFLSRGAGGLFMGIYFIRKSLRIYRD